MKKKYGLIGHPLGHTLSPALHRQIMKDCGIEGTYRAYDIDPERFGVRVGKLMNRLDGFNITIPYKEKIAAELIDIDEASRPFGAINTVFRHRGYNTDYLGFRRCGIPFYKKRVLLLGAGGVGRVLLYEAVRAGAKEVTICTRRPEQALTLRNELKEALGYDQVLLCDRTKLTSVYDVILNATPVGMWPACDGIPVPKEILPGAEYVFDSIYNPLATKLVLAARSVGVQAQNGLAMLYHQALEAQKIWNPDADFSTLSALMHQVKLKRRLLRLFPVKLVLTGFMGSGKTTVGKALAKALHVGFVDLDVCVVEEKRKPIHEIFKNEGEPAFRQAEQLCLSRVLKEKRTLVIATGGGALMNPENVELVRKHQGFILFLSVDLEVIRSRVGKANDRPLLHGKEEEQVRNLYESRVPVYNSIADCVVEAGGSVNDTVLCIKTMLNG